MGEDRHCLTVVSGKSPENMWHIHVTNYLETYLIFVISFTRAKFSENKIYTEKRVNYKNGFRNKIAEIMIYWAKQRKNG